MDCIVKIQLKKEAPVKKILNIFKVNKSKERAFFKETDTEMVTLNNVLCIPYGQVGEDPQIVTDFLIFKLAETFGVKEKNLIDGNEYPCYYVQNTQTFLTTESEFLTYGLKINNPLDDKQFMNDESTLSLHNDPLNKIPILFVNNRKIFSFEEDCPHKIAIKDAYERADFLIYDHIQNK